MTLRRLLGALERVFVPLFPGVCRQPITKPCTCSWLPRLPEE